MMTEFDQVRHQLPHEWRSIDLKKVLGERKTQAAEYIRTWKQAGYIEHVPGKTAFYRFTPVAPGASAPTTARKARMSSTAHVALQAVPAARQMLAQGWNAASTVARQPETRRLVTHPWFLAITLVPVVLLFVMFVNMVRAPATANNIPATPVPAEPVMPVLEHAVVAWYGPGGEVFGAVETGATYQPVARYGDAWVQVDFVDTGLLWVRSADVAGVDLSGIPDLRPPVGGYSAHIVAPGDTLQQIATAGGSDTALISSYNRLNGALQPGRPLIIPRLEGQSSILPPVPPLVKQGLPDQPRVALTVDLETGDEPLRRMLDILRERNVQITFFVLASWVQQHPDLARQMAADGHEFANHSLTHTDFRQLSDEQIAHELAETERIVYEITGSTTRPFFRPPYGGHDERVLQRVLEQGYLTIYWSIDSRDAVGATKSPEWLVQHVAGTQSPESLYGAVVLTHCCGRTTSVEALPALLDRFNQLGLEVVTMSEVLGS
jgi:peptidoglycan/xylan/chitin deacetylase (PgdA/CDA1 family)